MARASVKFTGGGASYTVRGYKFKKAETKILTNEGDIAYFKASSSFMVKDLVTSQPTESKPQAKAGKSDGGDGGNGDNGPLPWKVGMKKTDLIAAAESRGIAVTADDKVPEIIQLLKEHDDSTAPAED